MKTEIEIFKDAILGGDRATVTSMIKSNPSLLNAKEPNGQDSMICVFLIANTSTNVSTAFLLYPLERPELDWSLKGIHLTILRTATERRAEGRADLLEPLKKNKNFMSGNGTKTINELAVENQNKYQKLFNSALKTNHRNKESIISDAKKKLDVATNIVEFLNKPVEDAPNPGIQQSGLPQNHSTENLANNIASHLSMFNAQLQEYQDITAAYHQEQIKILEEDYKARVKLMEKARDIIASNPNPPAAPRVATEKSSIFSNPPKKQEERECIGCTIL